MAEKLEIPVWDSAYRVISSSFPPITLFEDILDPAELQMAYALESLTNDRLAEEVGLISRVAPEDRVSGHGSTPVMAAFTHIGKVSRFTDGTFGLYYAASSQSAAIAETSFHQERFLAATNEPDVELTMRTYVNKVVKPMHDIRAGFAHLHDPDPANYSSAQAFAKKLREGKSWGLLYNSVRASGHECIAAFRPPAVSIPVQGKHIRYVWEARSQKIGYFFEITQL
ncbi:MAG: RES family NAD+ phosphorylase [Pseudomonas sp.]|uniref:RES family NAD+ phosphorylase n=1 Tax=Pseudomonas sp. UMAB-08 TaxID=1365375 RepID=UPI001C55FD28|nr:RES family NAD+ phosphorylase [Pseudomonas sp. UMAB-08]